MVRLDLLHLWHQSVLQVLFYQTDLGLLSLQLVLMAQSFLLNLQRHFKLVNCCTYHLSKRLCGLLCVPEQTRKTQSEFQNTKKILLKSSNRFVKGMAGWNRRLGSTAQGPFLSIFLLFFICLDYILKNFICNLADRTMGTADGKACSMATCVRVRVH